jgi:hypothetical protein
MSRNHALTRKLLADLLAHPSARLGADENGWVLLGGASNGRRFSGRLVASLRSSGLLKDASRGRLMAGDSAQAWIKRQDAPGHAYAAQHSELEERSLPGDSGTLVLANAEESPVAGLARRAQPGGEPWISKHAGDAAERLRRDFERGGLQPRITANWTASVSSGRRSGKRADITDLTEAALSARLRFERAVKAVGPELSGVLIDVCCFLKGLETVERERLWPARSAKLVLRLALEALARHYGLEQAATAATPPGRLRHWGDADYRPEIS